MEEIDVWFLLVDDKGNAINGNSYGIISTRNIIIKFRNALKSFLSDSELKGISPMKLRIFQSIEDVKGNTNAMDDEDPVIGHSTRETALYVVVPDQNPTSSQSSIVPIESRKFYKYCGEIKDLKDVKGNRQKLYYYAMNSYGLYPMTCKAFYYDNQEDKAKILLIHVIFEAKQYALEFENQAIQLNASGAVSSCSLPANWEEKRIYLNDYVEEESDSLPYTVDVSSVTTVAENDELYIYQRIEDVNYLHFSSHARISQKAHIIPKVHCTKNGSFAKYKSDVNNVIVLSMDMHYIFDQALPLFKLSFVEASADRDFNGRYKVLIDIEMYDSECANLILPRLKEGTLTTPNPLIFKTFIHVLDPVILKTCLDWRSNNIQRKWDAETNQ